MVREKPWTPLFGGGLRIELSLEPFWFLVYNNQKSIVSGGGGVGVKGYFQNIKKMWT